LFVNPSPCPLSLVREGGGKYKRGFASQFSPASALAEVFERGRALLNQLSGASKRGVIQVNNMKERLRGASPLF